jgi:hypothetical protein
MRTGRGCPWTAEQEEALRAAVAAHGRCWEEVRGRVEEHGEFAALRAHLGAPQSRCLRKHWDALEKKRKAAA